MSNNTINLTDNQNNIKNKNNIIKIQPIFSSAFKLMKSILDSTQTCVDIQHHGQHTFLYILNFLPNLC